MTHAEFQTVRGGDGMWRAHCKTCDWAGPPRRHPLDTSTDSLTHTEETTTTNGASA